MRIKGLNPAILLKTHQLTLAVHLRHVLTQGHHNENRGVLHCWQDLRQREPERVEKKGREEPVEGGGCQDQLRTLSEPSCHFFGGMQVHLEHEGEEEKGGSECAILVLSGLGIEEGEVDELHQHPVVLVALSQEKLTSGVPDLNRMALTGSSSFAVT